MGKRQPVPRRRGFTGFQTGPYADQVDVGVFGAWLIHSLSIIVDRVKWLIFIAEPSKRSSAADSVAIGMSWINTVEGNYPSLDFHCRGSWGRMDCRLALPTFHIALIIYGGCSR